MFSVRVDGIPAQAKIVYYNPGYAGSCLSGPPPSHAAIQPPELEEIDFELYDCDGYPAPWLQDIVDEDEDIRDDVLEQLRHPDET